MDLSITDYLTANGLALKLAIILTVMLIGGIAFGLMLKVIKAPNWLYRPFITAGILLGMYFIFQFV